MYRYFLELSYLGTHYSGWQIQENAMSVQQKINEALTFLLTSGNPSQKKIQTTGCGRTDTGVHATQFFAHFDTINQIDNPKAFIYQLNGILPFDITIKNVHSVSVDAHARFDAVSRSYTYYLHTYKNGFLADFSGCYYKKLNIELMNEAAHILIRHNDFSSFCKSNAQSKTSCCSITHAEWRTQNGLFLFEITSNRFLRGMVRAVVGTLIEVGSGKISSEDFENIICSKDRRKAGPAAPACGLFLCKIEYPYLKNENSFLFPFQIQE